MLDCSATREVTHMSLEGFPGTPTSEFLELQEPSSACALASAVDGSSVFVVDRGLGLSLERSISSSAKHDMRTMF